MKIFNTSIVILALAFTLSLIKPITALSATLPTLGSAASFSVLANLSMSAAGTGTTISGDLGLSPGLAISRTGFWIVGGTEYFGPSSLATNAQADALIAFNNLAGQGSNGLWSGTTNPPPGVWTEPLDTTFTGTLTLSGGYDDVWVFQIGRDMVFSGSVTMLGNAQPCHVFWQIGRDTTIASGSNFVGTIIASRDISLLSGATVNGRVISLNSSLTTVGNTISKPICTPAPATIHVIKTLIKNNGSTLNNTDFSFSINGGAAQAFEADGQNDITVSAGTYTITEPAVAGYSTSYNNCSNLVILSGGAATCTITNDDQKPTLTLDKVLINNNGGTATEADWTLTAAGPTPISGPGATGSTDVISGANFSAGTYNLSESIGPAGYTASSWSCVKNSGPPATGASIILGLGDTAVCTITNDDIPATLHVIKHVINNSGGKIIASGFNVHVKNSLGDVTESPASPQVGVEDPGTSYTLAAGTYTVSEDTNPYYVRTFSGDCDALTGSVSLLPGDNKTCTITNDDIVSAPLISKITVIKVVVGGTKVIDDFHLFIDDIAVIHNVANVFSVGAHTVTETVDPNYTRSFALDCPNGSVSLLPGDNKTCIITNTYKTPSSSVSSYYSLPVPPLIDVVKVPSPLALPAGPGSVTYTYTLRNIGTVPVTNVTMVDDTCKSITFISGDTNANNNLDVNETWIYSCSTTLSATHTNTVVATGWANGISAIDIANATVIVGAPVVPPLIHVTKAPNPLTLPVEGGVVTYTERITNPGTVALSNINLTDDKCSPINYISGDVNNDAKLDPSETWTYTCKTKLTQTTTNTAIATGTANGLTARDFAIATVVVANAITKTIPVVIKLPNTGITPNDNNLPEKIVILISIFILVLVLAVMDSKKRPV